VIKADPEREKMVAWMESTDIPKRLRIPATVPLEKASEEVTERDEEVKAKFRKRERESSGTGE
jgi:hypothetical protein